MDLHTPTLLDLRETIRDNEQYHLKDLRFQTPQFSTITWEQSSTPSALGNFVQLK